MSWSRQCSCRHINDSPYGQGLARSEEQVSVAKIGLSGPIEDMQIKGAEINMVVEGYKT